MGIISTLKFLASLLLVCCLFLPLSQCTGVTEPKQGASYQKVPQREVITKQYAFNSVSETASWLNLLAFICPFVMIVLTVKSSHKIKMSLVVLVASVAALYSVFCVTAWSEKILLGGYLAYGSVVALIILSLLDIWFNFRRRQKDKLIISE